MYNVIDNLRTSLCYVDLDIKVDMYELRSNKRDCDVIQDLPKLAILFLYERRP